jgi:hypothetical protein
MQLNSTDLHHKDYYINKITNEYNKDIKQFQKDIIYYKNIWPDWKYQNKLENYKCTVLDDLEPIELKYIMHVDMLTENDFDHKILKDGEKQEKIDLDEDIELDKDDFITLDNIYSVKNTSSSVPVKRLFGKINI